MSKKTKHSVQSNKPTQKLWLDITWRIIVIGGLASTAWSFYYVAPAIAPSILELFSPDFNILSLLLIFLPVTATYVILLPAFLLVITNRSRSPRLQIVVKAVSLLAIFGAAYVLEGLWPGATSCEGIMGVHLTCFEAHADNLWIILGFMQIFQIISVPTLFFTIRGLLDEYRLHKSVYPASPR